MIRRCSALDIHGKACRCTKDLTRTWYHGDQEIYSYDKKSPQWVTVYLCPKHLEGHK